MDWKFGKGWQKKRKPQSDTPFKPQPKPKERFKKGDKVCFRTLRFVRGRSVVVYGLGYIVDLKTSRIREQGRTVGYTYSAHVWPSFQAQAAGNVHEQHRIQVDHFFDHFVYPTVAARQARKEQAMEAQEALPSEGSVLMQILERLNTRSFVWQVLPTRIPLGEVLKDIPEADFCPATYDAVREKTTGWFGA